VCPPLRGLLLAPHILVEDVSVTSIEQARIAYLETDLRQRLSRYHDEPRLGLLGLEPHLARPGVPALEHRRRDRHDPLPTAGGAGRGRPVRNA